MGQRPQNRRQQVVKFLWVGIWLAYLSAPVRDLLHGGHSDGVVVLGWIGLAAFVFWYFTLVVRAGRGERNGVRQTTGHGSRGSAHRAAILHGAVVTTSKWVTFGRGLCLHAAAS